MKRKKEDLEILEENDNEYSREITTEEKFQQDQVFYAKKTRNKPSTNAECIQNRRIIILLAQV